MSGSANLMKEDRVANEVQMHYYAAAGKRVKEGDPAAARQFLSDDPARPDAPADEKADSGPKALGSPSGPGLTLYYYDADGNRVSEPVAGGRQFTADDANRPDAKNGAEPAALADETAEESTEAPKVPAEEKAVTKPPANKARTTSANK